MKWAVDRIEENMVVLENIETKEKRELELSSLPSSIMEGNILVEDEFGNYKKDNETENNLRKEIEEKFQRLRRKA